MLEQRKHFIDIAKGLLIIFVVWFHMKTILSGSCGIEHPIFETLYSVHKIYAMFFMPAFFLITGYCSSYDKCFFDFLLSVIKGIIIPMFFLNFLPCVLSFNKQAFVDVFGTAGSWLYGFSFWFLPVLFLSKIFSWVLFRLIKNYYLQLVLAILLFAVAIIMTQYNILPNYWYWKTALAYVFFIVVGYLLRKNEEITIFLGMALVIYVVSIILILLNNYPIWGIGMSLNCTLSQMFWFLPISVCGCLSILFIAKLISRNNFLEYIGKASLVIYCSHWFIGQHIGKYLSYILPLNSVAEAILYYLVCVVTTIGCSCLLFCILNTRYLYRLLGKNNYGSKW